MRFKIILNNCSIQERSPKMWAKVPIYTKREFHIYRVIFLTSYAYFLGTLLCFSIISYTSYFRRKHICFIWRLRRQNRDVVSVSNKKKKIPKFEIFFEIINGRTLVKSIREYLPIKKLECSLFAYVL